MSIGEEWKIHTTHTKKPEPPKVRYLKEGEVRPKKRTNPPCTCGEAARIHNAFLERVASLEEQLARAQSQRDSYRAELLGLPR